MRDKYPKPASSPVAEKPLAPTRAYLKHATGTAEPDAAPEMRSGNGGELLSAARKTVDADRNSGSAAFVAASRALGVAPHAA